MATIGQRIKELREQANMNRPKLAREADVSYSFLVQVETGQRENPQADKLAKVARALGVPLDLLMATGEPLPPPADPGVSQLRIDLVNRINALNAQQLRAAARAFDEVLPCSDSEETAPTWSAPSAAQS